ncbi:hypothetical protein GRJ2_002823700 [Grus japonensis]|uniref:Uncharacterized protein n=1 Tax=Grus japonensis TaxID=30415 RepID=A0ABC9Y1X2_GRUJA
MEKTMVKQAVPLQLMEVHGGAEILPAAHGGPHAGAGGGTQRRLQPCGKPTLEQAPGRTGDPVGDPRWSSLFLKGCTPWKGPTLEQLVKDCSPWEGLTLEKLVEDCLPWEGPHAGAGAECEESSP